MGKMKKVDINKIPCHMRMDYEIKNKNIDRKLPLCKHCSGTGNELFSMYRKCPKCNGTGNKLKKN